MANLKNNTRSALKILLSGLSASEKRNIKALGILILIALVAGIVIFEYPNILKLIPAKKEGADKKQNAVPLKTFNFIGKITSIGKDNLVVSNGSVSKKVIVTQSTTITKLGFVPTMQNGEKRYVSQEKKLDFGSLKTGIQVEALGSINVSQASEFTAIHVRVLP